MTIQARIFELPGRKYVNQFLLSLLPLDSDVGGEDPSKAFVEYIRRKDGGMVPVFIQGSGQDYTVLYGGEIVKAARKASLQTVSVLIISSEETVDPADFAAYDKHGNMTLQEKVMAIMRLVSENDLIDPKEIARRICMPVNQVKHCLKLANGDQQIVKAWIAGEVSTTVLKAVVKRPRNEQAILAELMNENGKLLEEDIKDVRADLAHVTAGTLVPMWEMPDVSDEPIVWGARTTGDGIVVEVSGAGKERRMITIPVDKLLALE